MAFQFQEYIIHKRFTGIMIRIIVIVIITTTLMIIILLIEISTAAEALYIIKTLHMVKITEIQKRMPF